MRTSKNERSLNPHTEGCLGALQQCSNTELRLYGKQSVTTRRILFDMNLSMLVHTSPITSLPCLF